MSPADGASEDRFSCTPGGAIRAGRRRLLWLLLGPAVLMLAVALAVWIGGRLWPGALAAAVAAVAAFSWRMSGDLDALALTVGPGHLEVLLRSRRLRVPLAGASARRLGEEERAHLERLASVGVVVAGSGGFDSHLLGEFDLYASDLANAVLIEAGETRLVVTPDRPRAFLAAVENAARIHAP